MCNDGLGDRIEQALALAYITPELVERWVGDCGCAERKERLNQLGRWASRVLNGKLEQAKHYLEAILE